MTDTSDLLANSVGVSDQVLFNLKASSARSRSYKVVLQPINATTFQPSSQIIFTIPAGRRATYLDPTASFIKFSVQNNDVSGSSFNTDNNGYCFLNRIDEFNGGNLLTSTQSVNQLMTYLYDFQTSPSSKFGLSNMYGSSTDTDSSKCRQGMKVSGGQRGTFALPIPSPLIGIGADKALCVGRLKDDLRCEITLEGANKAVRYDTASQLLSPWSIVYAELHLTYIELSDEAESIVNSMTPANGPLFLHGNAWRHYVSNLPAQTTGTYSTLVPCRVASLKSLVLLPRPQVTDIDARSYSLSSRANPSIANFWYRVGSTLVPSRPITLWNASNTSNYSEAFAELQKSFHSLQNPDYSGSIPYSNYNVVDVSGNTTGDLVAGGGLTVASSGIQPVATGATSYTNGFALALDMEVFANKSSVLMSGLNTTNANIFFEAQIGVAPVTAIASPVNGSLVNTYGAMNGPANNYVLDFFANYDLIYQLDNGILTSRF
jgi:hypothetical protein